MESMHSYIDATILNPGAKLEEFVTLCNDAIRYEFPAICVPPFMVDTSRELLNGSKVKVASVVGFPAGYQTIASKINELRELIVQGVQEIDYVIHRGYLANCDWENIEEETLAWISICQEKNVISKWIIEASEISDFQMDKLIEIANRLKPDYVKTSTGVYGKAVLDHVIYLRKNLIPDIKIKAAGGISTKEIAEQFIHARADRIGVSQYLQLV